MSAEPGGRRYGLIGYPVSHSMSPAIFAAAFEALGIPATYELFPVSPDRLAVEVARLIQAGVKGLNVTVPHKTAVIPLMTSLDESARITGAVNTIVCGKGERAGLNTDVGGFSDALGIMGGPDVRGEEVLILGAGGAARAVVAALAKKRPSRILIANRDREKSEKLLACVRTNFPQLQIEAIGFRPQDIKTAASGSVLCVQATSLGLKPDDPLPAEPSLFPPTCFLFDLVYGSENTPFVRAASILGYKAVDGKEMLLRQAARTFSIWFGREAPLEAMRQAMSMGISARSR